MAVRLKICGLVRPEDLAACHLSGVDAVGVNLWPGSPRFLDLDRAQALLDSQVRGKVMRIGVFVDPDPATVVAAVRQLGLDGVQLHGDADPTPVASLGIPWVWVLRGTPTLEQLVVPKPAPMWVLLDAQTPGYGGEGVRTDWTWAAAAVQALAPLPVWLAGGIHPGNAATALGQVSPAGLDVASGAELGPPHPRGFKDPQRIAALASICGKVSPGDPSSS